MPNKAKAVRQELEERRGRLFEGRHSALDRYPASNRRHNARVYHPFVVRIRDAAAAGSDGRWDVTTARDISKRGLFINCSKCYQPGDEVEIRIRNPILGKDIHCSGTAIRCKPSEKMKRVYEAAFRIGRVNEPDKAAFAASVEFFEEQ